MALAHVEGHAIIRGNISLPRIGAWHADIWVDNADGLEGKVTVDVGGELDLVGTVNRGLAYQGITQLRIVAGGDGLRKPAKPKHYRAPSIRTVLADLAADAGEIVASSADATVLAMGMNFWTTHARATGQMVAALVQNAPAETAWRILANGELWIGPETWPDSGIEEWVEISEDGCNDVVEVGLDAPVLVPGTLLGDRKVDHVQHRIDPGSVRSLVWTIP